MIIYTYAHESFDNYPEFMRGITVAIESYKPIDDDKIHIWCGGPHKLNDFTAEYINKTTNYFRQKKIKTKYVRSPQSTFLKDLDNDPVSVILYFGNKDYEPFFDAVMSKAKSMDIPTTIYKG
jgi:hypothetical protein